jgi:ribosomal protein S18 acetylase RimI-like enzyme
MPIFGPQFDGLQLQYTRWKNVPYSEHNISVVKAESGGAVARMVWDSEGKMGNVHVDSNLRRKGIATKMWQFAQSLSQQDPTIAPIRHSDVRTKAGDSWARKVGGDLPPLKDGKLVD